MDDCHTPESCYKLILSLGSLIERPSIKAQFDPKYLAYAKMIEEDFESRRN